MARKQRGKGPGQGPQQPQGGGGGWAPLRDAVRRDIEQAVSAQAFAERLHQKMDTQRRAFLDFPRVMEQLRSGAMERLTASLARLYEGGQGFDLQRFLRDLPLALAQLAAADKSKSQPPPAPAEAAAAPAEAAPSPAPEPGPSPERAPAPAAEPAVPVSPRLELRSKLLAAAPNLAKAATSYRRNVATVRRASLPRRSPGPWRADREVLEETRRAVEFVQKLYDAYAEAWADAPLAPNLFEDACGELDRFLAWTQLDRYVELAVLASTNAPRPAKPGQHVISAPNEVQAAEAARHEEPREEAKAEEPKPPEADAPAAGAEAPAAGAEAPAAESEPGRA
jgi:hypothetical protein